MFIYSLGVYLKLDNPTSGKSSVKIVSMVTNTQYFFTYYQIFISVQKEILLEKE